MGNVFVFAPAGIGIRESSLAGLLTPILGSLEASVVLATLQRGVDHGRGIGRGRVGGICSARNERSWRHWSNQGEIRRSGRRGSSGTCPGNPLTGMNLRTGRERSDMGQHRSTGASGDDSSRIGRSYYDDSGYFDCEAGSHLHDFTSRFQQYRIRKVLELLVPMPTDRVLDLGCGWGTISLALGPRVGEVVGARLLGTGP